MTNINIVEELISSIRKYIKILSESFKKYSQKEIEEDLFLKASLERYLYLVIQETINLAEAAISLKDFRRPDSYSNAFEILEEEKVISRDLCKKMVDMTGFRNVVSHDYKKLDFKIVYDVLQNRLVDIEEFIAEIEKVI
ncbi:MAG: DUF86 domain-containing protein [bacterium]